jgi:phosphate transport system permease protein
MYVHWHPGAIDIPWQHTHTRANAYRLGFFDKPSFAQTSPCRHTHSLDRHCLATRPYRSHRDSIGNRSWYFLAGIRHAQQAGVPSVIYGLLGLQIFVRSLRMGGSLLAGACTLALLVLPVIIVSTREALKAVPSSLREASYGMGATKWQTVWHQVLPAASGGILTGIILALSRAVGETAPLIVIGALAYVPFVAESPMDEFTVLPIQIFNWASRPQEAFLVNAAAAIIVLLTITFCMNGIAIYLRNRWQKRISW